MTNTALSKSLSSSGQSNRILPIVVATAFLSSPLNADDWPHWRGPQRSAIVKEASGWKDGGWLPAAPAWSKNVGQGGTSPLVVGKVYTMGWQRGQDTVHCLDAATGKEVWSVSYRCPEYGRFKTGDEGFYSGPSSTPEYDAETGFLYTLSIDGDLNCWDTRQRGRRVWGFNLYDRYAVRQRPRIGRQGLRDYGYTSSPLVQGDWLLVEVGAKEGNLMAFTKRTGQRAWASRCQDPAGHNAGPAPITVQGVPCVAVLTIHNLVVIRLDPDNAGQTVAQHPWATEFANNIAAPAVHEDCVLITSGYNHNAICKLRITLQGAVKEWEKRPHHSKVCTPVIYKGHVYWAWQTVKCLDWNTGALKWEGGTFSDPGSCLVSADGRLIVWGHNGKLALVDTADHSPHAYRELAVRDRIFATHAWPHVVLAGSRLFCKDRLGNLKCFQIGS